MILEAKLGVMKRTCLLYGLVQIIDRCLDLVRCNFLIRLYRTTILLLARLAIIIATTAFSKTGGKVAACTCCCPAVLPVFTSTVSDCGRVTLVCELTFKAPTPPIPSIPIIYTPPCVNLVCLPSMNGIRL